MHKAIIKKGKVRYYYNVVATNGEIVSTSQKYFSRSNAVRAAYEAGYKVAPPQPTHGPYTPMDIPPPPLPSVHSPQIRVLAPTPPGLVVVKNDSPVSNKTLLAISGQVIPFYKATIRIEVDKLTTIELTTTADLIDLVALESETKVVIEDKTEGDDA